MWATLSSSTIAKSGRVTDTWSISSALPTDSWTAMGEGTPAGVTALGSYTAYSRTQEITLSNEGALSVSFVYSDGNDALQILGVDLLNSDGNEVLRSDYHIGSTGTNQSHNIYMLDHIASGTYKIRYIINGGITSSVGNITVKHINIKTASSFAEITNWYFIRMHSNQTHYMYYSGSGSSINFGGTQSYEDKYLWGFVKDTDGIRIYNRAAGSSVAIDNANPCTLSASGTSLAFTIGTGSAGNNGAAAGAYFSLFVNPDKSATAKSYLNYRSNGTIQRWSGDDEGSALMIDEVPFSEGRIYTIKAYFTSYTDRYFTNNDGALAFNTAASNGVKDYWILRPSGNDTYLWKFESGRGDGKFLTPTSDGLSTTGGWVQINNCGTNATYYHLYGSVDGATTSGDIRNLATWSPEGTSKKSGFAKYGSGGCYGSSHNNTEWSTDYAIEEVTGVDLYTVVCNIPSGGITYTPSYTGVAAQANGGFYILASAPSASDFTKKDVANYTAGDVVVDATAKTITLNYTANISYTLTDMNGAAYSWSASGSFGTAPTITGCAGYTLDNEVWDEETRAYTADITFPFPVSSNDVTNWTYIGSFASLSRTSQYAWHVTGSDATDIITQSNVLPTNEDGEIEKWEWSIEPTFSAGAFTFTIKNRSTSKYITCSSSQHNHEQGSVTLTNAGTSFTHVSGSAWKNANANYYLSINSYQPDPADKIQYLGQHGSTHYGTSVGYVTPADFTTLMANLKKAYSNYNNYLLYITTNPEKYTETVDGTMVSVYSTYFTTTGNVVKNSPTAYLTAAQFKTYTDAFNNAINGLRYVVPTFFRIKNVDGSKYVKAGWKTYDSYVQLDFAAGGTDASSIFYLNASNSIISYYSGSYLFSINHTKPVSYDEAAYRCTYEFLPGSDVNRVYVHVASNPSGWGGSETYWIATDTKVGRGTTPTANSDFLIEEVTSLPVTITAAKYATLCAPVALTIPSGVKAYYISDVTKTEATLTKLTGTIPAGMPVILYADGISVATTFDFPITTADSFEGTNKLSGQAAAQNVAADVAYTLQQEQGGSAIGFYPKTAGTIAGFRAYLLASELPVDVKGLRFRFDDADGISTVQGSEFMVNDSEIYNLAGQRLNKLQKGVNIVNGKKVLVK